VRSRFPPNPINDLSVSNFKQKKIVITKKGKYRFIRKNFGLMPKTNKFSTKKRIENMKRKV
jgi:hypothetical protein